MDYQALICLYISINEKISSIHSILLYIQKVKYYFTFTVFFCHFLFQSFRYAFSFLFGTFITAFL